MNSKTVLFLILSLCIPLVSAFELGELDGKQLTAMQQEQDALIIDIRTEQEWATTGVIPESQKLEFFNAEGQYDIQQWLAKLNKLRTSPDQPIVLVCRSGNRSEKVGQFLTHKLGMKNVYHLKNGIMPWIKAGNTVTKDCPPNSTC